MILPALAAIGTSMGGMAAAGGAAGMAGMSAVGGIVGGVGSAVSALAAGKSAEQNVAIAEYNAQVNERNRLTTLALADSEAIDKDRENRRRMASMRATFGASGLAFGGSQLDVLEDQATEAEYDIAKTRYKGKLKAIGYADEAANQRMKGEMFEREASFAPFNAVVGATSKIFGGFGQGGAMMLRGA